MDRRRAAAALLALAACFACSTAAPTATDHTALELVDGHTEGCYYNFQHYGEGDRIMTNEPCLNCTCHNRMLMCYLRVCPFTKPIGQDCTVEKRADQCCPIVTCPDVPVDLLTSTSTSSPAEYGATGLGKPDKYGCSINGKYISEGSKVPSTPNKPCEHCYCIRNMTTCVMQECTLHVDGCTPIYHKDVCCPVRYSCDHPEDEIPLLDDMTTTVRPTPGFLLTTTTTMIPVTQASQDCVHEDQVFPDGAHIKTEKACEHCYCMKGDIVCVVQGCGTPMENEGKNCTALPLRSGQCCPDTYICEGDEQNVDLTTDNIDQSTMPPRRVGIEGSGYRNEPDEPFKDMGTIETDVEGSGDEYIISTPIDIDDSSVNAKPFNEDDKILATTTYQDIPASQTTESGKEENDIPNKDYNVDADKTSSEIPEQNISSFTTEPSSELLYTATEMETTASDEGQNIDQFVSKKEEIFTTESVFRKEDKNVDSDTMLHEEENKVTASFDGLTEEAPYKEPEFTGADEFITESVYDKKATTESTKYISDYIDTTKHRDDIFDSQTESVYTEKQSEDKILSETTTIKVAPTTSSHITQENIILSEVQTTTINSVYNEINDNSDDNIKPARIPGEGDCLLNGITYSNNSNVPRSNNCHTSCKCVSSIIKCDPIICSPPPEYIENMNDCQPIYDSPDSCCPTYVCSAKETIPPQSHSQMSGTESPKPIETVECDDSGNCGPEKDEKYPSIPAKPCLSDDCIDKSTKPEVSLCESKDCAEGSVTVPPKLEDCSNGKCIVSPVACEGENCYKDSSEEPINVDYNAEKELQVKDSSICNDKEGCPAAEDTLQEECTNEICRRKDEPKQENKKPLDCSGDECKTSIDVALTTKSDVNFSPNAVTEESISDIESTSNVAVIEKEKNDQASQDIMNQTEIIDNAVTTEPEEVTDQLINVVSESEYTRLPTSQTTSDEIEDIKPIEEQYTIVTAEESQKTNIDEVTEKMNIGLISEKEKSATEKEPIYTELPVDEFDSLTTESIISDDKDSDIHKAISDGINTVIPTSEYHEVTKAPEITELELSTPIHSTQSSTDYKPTDLPETSDITQTDKTYVSEEGEKDLSQSTTIPTEEIDKIKEIHDSIAITTDLPDSEFVSESHHEAPITNVEKDSFEVFHTTQVLEETSTNRNIHEQMNIITNAETTEPVGLQNEMTEQIDLGNSHEIVTSGIPDKLGTEQQFITDKPEIMTDRLTTDLQLITDQPDVTSSNDIVRVSEIGKVSNSNTFKDEMTTKSYYDITEENTQYKEITGYSTTQNSESIRPDIGDENKPSGGLDYTTPLQEEKDSQVVTENTVSHTDKPETTLNGDGKLTDPDLEEEFTKIPHLSVEQSGITSEVPDREITKADESDNSKKQDPNTDFSEEDNEGIKQTMVTEMPKDSLASTEPIITSSRPVPDMTDEIEEGKPKDTEKELNTLSTQSIDLLTIKDYKQFTEDTEILTTESIPKYTLNVVQHVEKSTNSDILENGDDKQPKIHDESTTLRDIWTIQESSTSPQNENIQNEIQTIVPDSFDNKPKHEVTEIPENKLTTAQFDIIQEVLKADELLTEKDQNIHKFSTESPELNTVAIEDVEIHTGTTSKSINDEEEHKSTGAEDLSEKSTLKPYVDQTNIEEKIESSTSFITLDQSNTEKEIESSTSFVYLGDTKEIEKPTISPNDLTEKVQNQISDSNKLQTLDDEKTSISTTEKSLSEELYPSHTTYESIQTEASTEQIPVPTAELTKEKDIEEKQEENNPDKPEITETEKLTTTASVVTSQDQETKSPEHPTNVDDSLIPERGDKFDETTLLTSEKDNVNTDAPHAPVTNIPYTKASDELEKETETTTKISFNEVLFTTITQEQASETPENVDHYKIPETQKEITPDGSLTSENPEKVPTEHSYATSSSPLQEMDVEENKVTQPVEQQSNRENVTPTDIISFSQQTESITENIFASSKSEDEILYEEEKKPVTESIILDEKRPESPLEHHVPVFVQDTELTHPEVTTVSASIIDSENDQELKVTHFISTKPQEQFTYETDTETDSVTEVYEKEKSSEGVHTDITTELSMISLPDELLVNVPMSTMHPEKSTEKTDLKQSEITESERVTTEIYVSETVSSTPSVLEIVPEEKETLKPISDENTTEKTNNLVTENEPSDSLDISTELPDKIETDIYEVTTTSLQNEYITSADLNKDTMEKSPEVISSEIEDVTQIGTEVPESDNLTSPAPINEDIHPGKDNTLSPSDLSIPTEPILTQKELYEATTENVKEDISDLDTNVPISTEEHKNDKEVTHLESTYSETTPFSVELEEHTHSFVHESSTGLPISEISTEINYVPQEPERGDIGDNEEQAKPTETLPLDFEHKEKPETPIKHVSGQNVDGTVTPIKLDNETVVSTDSQSLISTFTDEPIRHIPTTPTEELVLSSSQQTMNEQESNTTEQPIQIPISSATSTERDISLSSENPIKQDQTQSVMGAEIDVTEKLPQPVTSDKFGEAQTDTPIDKVSDEKLSSTSTSSPIPELSKPIFSEEPVEDNSSPDFPPSGTGGYGQEPDYVEEDQAFGPGTCRYGGKVYVSAQQIPRDDPCDFCFCFRSDIICLQQSCPPPIHGCHEEPIQGFCCPRYECPVSMATTLNMTTTTTTTTTTLPPHFLPHAYKGAAQRRGCQIKGHTYKVGEVVRASSGPCLHCTCGGDGQMKCDPKACTPEPMLRQMIAAAVSAKRRR